MCQKNGVDPLTNHHVVEKLPQWIPINSPVASWPHFMPIAPPQLLNLSHQGPAEGPIGSDMVRLWLFSWPSLRAPSNCLGRHRHPHPHRLCPWRLLFLQPRKWMNPTSFVDLIGAPKAPTMAPLGGQPYGLRPRSEVGGTCGETVDIIHNLWSSSMVVDILNSITEGRPYHGELSAARSISCWSDTTKFKYK